MLKRNLLMKTMMMISLREKTYRATVLLLKHSMLTLRKALKIVLHIIKIAMPLLILRGLILPR